jgi:hypothetical protein
VKAAKSGRSPLPLKPTLTDAPVQALSQSR